MIASISYRIYILIINKNIYNHIRERERSSDICMGSDIIIRRLLAACRRGLYLVSCIRIQKETFLRYAPEHILQRETVRFEIADLPARLQQGSSKAGTEDLDSSQDILYILFR